MTRILIVEDEPALSDPLDFLLRREGYETEVAADGREALVAFDRAGADLVLLDLMLPGLPGTEVCRELRNRSSVPIIMLTAKDSEVDIVVGLELGADDYVTKPYSSRELLARIRAVLRRRVELLDAIYIGIGRARVVLGTVTRHRIDLVGHRAIVPRGRIPARDEQDHREQQRTDTRMVHGIVTMLYGGSPVGSGPATTAGGSVRVSKRHRPGAPARE